MSQAPIKPAVAPHTVAKPAAVVVPPVAPHVAAAPAAPVAAANPVKANPTFSSVGKLPQPGKQERVKRPVGRSTPSAADRYKPR